MRPGIPLRARLPWFLIWVPLACLLYLVVNGGGYWQAGVYWGYGRGPTPLAGSVFRLRELLCGPFGGVFWASLVVLFGVSWRMAPQWSSTIRHSAWIVAFLLTLAILGVQKSFVETVEGSFGWIIPTWKTRTVVLRESWRLHTRYRKSMPSAIYDMDVITLD